MDTPQNPTHSWKSAAACTLIPALVCALAFVVCRRGYDDGTGEPGEMLLAPLFWLILSVASSIALLGLLVKMIYGPFENPWERGAWIVFFLFALPVALACYYNAAYVQGQGHGWHCYSRERLDLRSMGLALAAYRNDRGAWPPTLSALVNDASFDRQFPAMTSESKDRIRHSAFNEALPLRYAVENSTASLPQAAWLLWFPGPNRKYDIEDGPELKAALAQMRTGGQAAWLRDRTYDPSNGVSSCGDLLLNKYMLDKR